MIHAVVVGLAVVELALGRSDSKRRASAAIETIFALIPPVSRRKVTQASR
jgi:hypothetical protein